MSPNEKTPLSFSGFQFLYTIPPQQGQSNPHLEKLNTEYPLQGLQIVNLRKAMKEIVLQVKQAEKKEKRKYSGFVLNYQLENSEQKTRQVYFANKRTDLLPYSVALNLQKLCSQIFVDNWITAPMREQMEMVKPYMDNAPVGTSAFFRVRAGHYYLVPLRPEDIVVNRENGAVYKM